MEINKHTPERIRDYLAKGWLTHDGMWYFITCKELGFDKANELNRSAIRAMVPMEIQRTMKILGIENKRFGNFQELVDFMMRALDLLMPGSIIRRFKATVPDRNVFQWEWQPGECFAYKGVTLMGVADSYICGVMYRIKCWLDVLEVDYRMEPMPDACMMYEKGYCRGKIITNFET